LWVRRATKPMFLPEISDRARFRGKRDSDVQCRGAILARAHSARGSCRTCGRIERAHKVLENPQKTRVFISYHRRSFLSPQDETLDPVRHAVISTHRFSGGGLKHQRLFLHSLDSVTTIRRLVAFYVDEHNRVLPHSAFRGQTPDEMYFGTGDAVPADLTSCATAARRTRVAANRSASCERCPSVGAAA
jgi:hypothetical protein